MNKNDIIEVEITGYSSEGYGVSKPGGYVLFVPGALRGEKAQVQVVKAGKSFGYARIVELRVQSPQRAVPECPSARLCGGCGLWHMSMDEELMFKRQKVQSDFDKAGIDISIPPIIAAGDIRGCRNKAQYPVRAVGGKTAFGFYRRASHDVVEGRCIIQPEIFRKIAADVCAFADQNGILPYDERTLSGSLRHIYLRASKDLDQIMLCLVTNSGLDCKKQLAEFITGKYSQITTVCVNRNERNTNVILGDDTETVYGSGFITDTLCGKKFEISPQSFYQVNHAGCEKLYSLVREFSNPCGKRVLDLYCGIGTIGICAAFDASRLMGVEIVAQAIENAKKNARLNGLENTSFVTADAANIADVASGSFDVITVDPPRHGCDRKTLDYIIKSRAEKLVYVSCDSATLARDAKILASDYKAVRAACVNMFPRTKHIETVTEFTRI